MRGRPDVDVKVPTVVHPGDAFPIVVILESHSDTPIDFIDLTWRGREILSLTADGQQELRDRPIVDETVRLRGKGTLEEGKHRFEAEVKVPAGAPGSYLGVRIHIRYHVQIHVAIPWWPDLRETFDVLVEPRPTARPKPAPAVRTNQKKDESPFVEISLGDTAFAAGDEVSGAFAIGNAPSRDDLGVEVSLVALELVEADALVQRGEQYRYMVPTTFRAPKAGVEVPFRFRVPRDVHPSFASPWCRLLWIVHAALRTSWSRTVATSVNVTIGRYATAHDPTTDRPRIGAQKWRRLWTDAGVKHGFDLARDRLALEGRRGEIQIDVAREEDEDEPLLVATLRYPSLGLDIRSARQLLLILPSELESRLPGHKVECREPPQGLAFLTPRLQASLSHFKEIRITDTHIVAATPGGGLDVASLDDFLYKTAGLAEALIAAIAQIPPPAAMESALRAWRDFASYTGAHFSPGGMVLTSAGVDGALFDIATLFNEKAEIAGTRLRLELDPPLPFELSMTNLATFSAAPPGSRELALALRATVEDLVVTSSFLQATLPTPIENPFDLRPKLTELLALSRRLRGERPLGPYR